MLDDLLELVLDVGGELLFSRKCIHPQFTFSDW